MYSSYKQTTVPTDCLTSSLFFTQRRLRRFATTQNSYQFTTAGISLNGPAELTSPLTLSRRISRPPHQKSPNE